MPVNDELGKRMKGYYENISKTKLIRRTPVAIRIDGKAFHTFTNGFQRPFDEILIKSMQETMKYLCENIQGCVLGYTQSDEITLILVDYKKLTSSAWFDYEVQKLCSIAASMATMAFNKAFDKNFHDAYPDKSVNTGNIAQYLAYDKAQKRGAMFDARAFNVPKEEVTNLIYWRQIDASRNSVQMIGQTYFSDKELDKKSCSKIQDMLMEKFGINWNNYPTYQKRGSCCIKETYYPDASTTRTRWIIDKEIPIFKGENRVYIERLIHFDEG